MKRKYFLRGLGMGILVTAVVLTISHKAQNTSLTDAEIMAKAEELGMVKEDAVPTPEESALPETTAVPESSAAPEATKGPEDPKNIKQPEDTEVPKVSISPEPVKSIEPEETKKPESTKKPEKSEKPKETDTPKKSEKKVYITVKIERGMWSDDVARAMERAGLVKDAEDFDRYLCDEGYSSFISTGSYKIPEGATYYQIASIITGQ